MSERVNKVWGWEEVIVNNGLYCGKILHLRKGSKSSLHYHKLKHETFYVLKGRVGIQMNGSTTVLKQGESATIALSQPHRFIGLRSSQIAEFSTPHSDEDVYRLEPSEA